VGGGKGSFTGATERRIGRFEYAHGGTLFLDEIGEMPLHLQAKLLRVLQEKLFERIGSSRPLKADVRIIAATNRNLEVEVQKGNFREDLYWRLNVVAIPLPSLRERQEDIPLLVGYYLKQFNKKYNKDVTISEEVMEIFKNYHWPGNIRELANTIQRLVIMAETNIITKADLPINMLYAHKNESQDIDIYSKKGLLDEIEQIQKQRIIHALKNNGYIQSRAARALGITPRQLAYRIRKYKIQI